MELLRSLFYFISYQFLFCFSFFYRHHLYFFKHFIPTEFIGTNISLDHRKGKVRSM